MFFYLYSLFAILCLKRGTADVNTADREPSNRLPALAIPKEKAQRSILHAFAFKKLCHSHALWMLHIQTQKIFVACENNIHIRHNSRV